MRTDWIVKLNFLLLGFGLTAYFIYQVNMKGLSPNLLSILGIEAPAQAKLENQPTTKRKITWCETRVSGLLLPDSMKLVQEGPQWIIESSGPEGDQRRVVDFIAAEKWLAKYCSLTLDGSVVDTSPDAVESAVPAMIIKYVNGEVGVLKKTPQGDLLWKGQIFRSSALSKAIDELLSLPTARSKEKRTH